jgi:glycosyltransferase involved in cell wall biosynthesis
MKPPHRIRVQYTRYQHIGAHSGFTQLLRYLDAGQFRIDLYGASDNDDDLLLPVPALRRRLRARVQRGGMAWYKLSDLNGELWAAAAALAGRVDLVHALEGEHAIQYLPRWLRALPGRRVKLVASFHQPPALLPELVDPRILPQFDCITLVAPAQEPFFRQHLPPGRIRVILHGIDSRFFVPGPARPAAGDRFRCVMAGHWLRDFAALERVAEALLGCPEFLFEVVTNRDVTAGRLPNVLVHRDIDDQALRRTYQQADVLFLPLLDATANNALLEGMACGLPVVSTDLPAVRAYVGDGGALLVPAGSVDGYAQALLALQADPARRRALAQGARRRAEELDWSVVAQSYADLYRELLHG